MMLYQHTQVGYVTLIALAAGIVPIVLLMLVVSFNWVVLVVLIILAVSLWLFSTLTVEIRADTLQIRFGPGLIRKTFLLKDIAAYRAVKNPWYYGWGIHLTPHGWLYNVSGFWAVELQMKSGKRYRIGTDDAEGLVSALDMAQAGRKA
jgi:hypothetical protein